MSCSRSLFPHPSAPSQMHPTLLPPFVNASTSDIYREELWQACAGSLVYVPKRGDKVWYFPQGHMEQVTASTQQPSNTQQLPNSGLAPQILCRVVNRVLSAEPDTDEVYAQVSLLPIAPEVEDLPDNNTPTEGASPSVPQQNTVRMFVKILTASDTSTHGGFSVLRRHAEECLPPLDMTQDTPSQDLVAKDLHGHEWKFRHTYRGHPRRHLLTTGWSVFVSNKKLLAGDAVIFLREKNGELRVGIRRAKRQQTVQQAVMSSHSMHMGIVATANHAIGTRTIFSVFYKPRVSCSAFLVPVERLFKIASVSLSVGMRFKMKFEAEDASDRSCMGTIMGMEDLDPTNWSSSKWRSVKVNWDENNNEWPDRVSPWEIEVIASPTITNSSLPRPKRPRSTTMIPLASEFPGLTPESSAQLSRVLQGQEPQNTGIKHPWRTAQENSQLLLMHAQRQQQRQVPQQFIAAFPGRPLHPSSPKVPFYTQYPSQPEAVKSPQTQGSSIGGQSVIYGSSWITASKEASRTWSAKNTSSDASTWQDKSFFAGNMIPALVQQQQQQQQSSAFATWQANKQEKAMNSATPAPQSTQVENRCKLFGISLTDFPSSAKMSKQAHFADSIACVNTGTKVHSILQQSYAQVAERELTRPAKSDATSDPEKSEQNVVESRNCLGMRSRIKVIMKGNMVGRGIDLTKFDNYASLLEELESMFNIKGELSDPSKGWQVVYSDSEGDTMKVGDDPWLEFCGLVKKIKIICPEEAEKMDRQSPKEACQSLQDRVPVSC